MHAMGRYRTAFNTTLGPVAIDDDGRTLGGHEWGPVRARTDVVEAAVDRGVLTLVEPSMELDGPDSPVADDVNELAVDALRRTAELNELAAHPPAPSDLTDAELGELGARELVSHLREHPGDADRVDTIEAARPAGRRSTVDEALVDARKLHEEV